MTLISWLLTPFRAVKRWRCADEVLSSIEYMKTGEPNNVIMNMKLTDKSMVLWIEWMVRKAGIR